MTTLGGGDREIITRVMTATLGDRHMPSHASRLILCAEQEPLPCERAD